MPADSIINLRIGESSYVNHLKPLFIPNSIFIIIRIRFNVTQKKIRLLAFGEQNIWLVIHIIFSTQASVLGIWVIGIIGNWTSIPIVGFFFKLRLPATPNMVTVVEEMEVVYDPRVSVFVLGQLRTIA